MKIAGVVSILFFAACAPQPSFIHSQSSPIIGGTNDTGDPGVVLLQATVQGGYSLCSAEIVSPHVVMTAAHCVDPDTVGQVQSFDVFFGSDVNGSEGQDASKWIKVSETHYNMNFDPNQLQGGQDVAVAILAQPTTVTPLAMNRTALTQSDDGQALRLVGYGIDSGSDQQGTSAGTKRQTSTPLIDYDSNFIEFGTGQKGTCEGDSGGPAFLTLSGKEVIAGITSFGPQGCNGDPSSTDTRVDTVAVPFVDPYIAKFDPNTGNGNGNGNGNTSTDGGTGPGNLGSVDMASSGPTGVGSTDGGVNNNNNGNTDDAGTGGVGSGGGDTGNGSGSGNGTGGRIMSSGCSMGGSAGSSAAALLFVLFGLGALVSRRRRRI